MNVAAWLPSPRQTETVSKTVSKRLSKTPLRCKASRTAGPGLSDSHSSVVAHLQRRCAGSLGEDFKCTPQLLSGNSMLASAPAFISMDLSLSLRTFQVSSSESTLMYVTRYCHHYSTALSNLDQRPLNTGRESSPGSGSNMVGSQH